MNQHNYIQLCVLAAERFTVFLLCQMPIYSSIRRSNKIKQTTRRSEEKKPNLRA